MSFKQMWLKINGLFKKPAKHIAGVNSEGLLSEHAKAANEIETKDEPMTENADEQVEVKQVTNVDKDKNQSIDKLKASFDQLVQQLAGINSHLDAQARRHEQLMEQMEQLPDLLRGFPGAVENQRKITELLVEEVRSMSAMDKHFVDTVAKIPDETSKQTDALISIAQQLSESAEVEERLAGNFDNFTEGLQQLNSTSSSHRDSIMQMSKTFATSDRYLKYLVNVNNRRLVWVFSIAIAICILVIVALVGMILYLGR